MISFSVSIFGQAGRMTTEYQARKDFAANQFGKPVVPQILKPPATETARVALSAVVNHFTTSFLTPRPPCPLNSTK